MYFVSPGILSFVAIWTSLQDFGVDSVPTLPSWGQSLNISTLDDKNGTSTLSYPDYKQTNE